MLPLGIRKQSVISLYQRFSLIVSICQNILNVTSSAKICLIVELTVSSEISCCHTSVIVFMVNAAKRETNISL